jgi:hypothetical protein
VREPKGWAVGSSGRGGGEPRLAEENRACSEVEGEKEGFRGEEDEASG